MSIRKMGLAILALVLLTVLVAVPVMAAPDDTLGGTIKDQLTAYVIPLVGLLLSGVVLVGALKVNTWLGHKIGTEKLVSDELIRQNLDKIMKMGVQYGVEQLERADWTKVSTKNEVVDHALGYVLKAAPDALAKLGIDVATPDGRKHVEDMLVARLLPHDQAPGTWDKQ